MGTRVRLSVAVLMLGTMLPSQVSGSPIPPSPGLWMMAADGSGERELVPSIGYDEFLDWSPDGSLVVYSSGGVMYVSDPEGEARTQVSDEGESAADPRWSPNGQWIAYESVDKTTYLSSLRLVSPDGQERRMPLAERAAGIDWSPDSRFLAYVRESETGPGGDLYILDIENGNERLLSQGDALYSQTNWSPAGDRIVFETWGFGLHVITVDGLEEIDLSEGLDHAGEPSWAPDGTAIAFRGEQQIYVSNPDGTDRRALVGGAHPDWAPNSESIAFTRSGELFLVSVDSGEESQLTDEYLRDDYSPNWSPDGQRIAFIGVRVQVLCGRRWPIEANVIGTPDDDTLFGSEARDVIAGLGGDDVISGLGEGDIICGGRGNDVLVGNAGNDQLYGERGMDDLDGAAGNDEIEGAGGNDAVLGGRGEDKLDGGSGDDDLDGGRGGKDRLDGGVGRDRCVMGEKVSRCEVV